MVLPLLLCVSTSFAPSPPTTSVIVDFGGGTRVTASEAPTLPLVPTTHIPRLPLPHYPLPTQSRLRSLAHARPNRAQGPAGL